MSTPFDKQKASYALGLNIGTNLKGQGITDFDVSEMARGIQHIMDGSPQEVDAAQAQALINALVQQASSQQAGRNAEEGRQFLEENAKRDGVHTTPSGLQYEVIKEGSGPKPSPTSQVTTHYHGTLIDGTVFDSSKQRGKPASFPVNGVIKGWQEALPMMPTGSIYKLYIPSELAYGERGAGDMIGPNTALVFEVELISVDS